MIERVGLLGAPSPIRGYVRPSVHRFVSHVQLRVPGAPLGQFFGIPGIE